MNTFTTKHSILALMLLIFTQGVYAQTKEGNNWHFGFGAAMTWNLTQTITNGGKTLTGLPRPLSGSAMTNQNEGVFSMSDANGQLLFYSDGMTIWNRSNQVMQNGTGLFGHNSSAQSGIVIPYPEQPGKYIVITVSLNPDHPNFSSVIGDRVAYSVVDMSLNGGLGGVVVGEKNILLTGAKGALGESLSAVRHSNGVDFWIVAVEKGAHSRLGVWEVTTAGLNTVSVGAYNLASFAVPDAEANGYLRFSNNGKYFAWPEYNKEGGEPSHVVHIGEFNPSDGTFSNIKFIDIGMQAYGAEFSPSNEFLYLVGEDPPSNLRAYNFSTLLTTPVNAAQAGLIKTFPGERSAALQLGPDGRLYGVVVNTDRMLVIDNPDDPINATAHRLTGLIPGGRLARYGLPNFLPHIFAPTPKEGEIGTNQTICNNTVPAQLTSIADAECDTETITYLWQRSTDSLSWSNATGTNNLSTYHPPALTATTYYRRNATSASCGTVHSNVVKITVAAAFNAGTISNSSTSIAYGTAPAAFTSTLATGGVGTITYNWQQSTNGTTWTNATGTRTNATYSPPALTTTTYFRRQATNTCGTVETSSVTITVGGSADLITVTGSTDICPGTATTLTASASSVTSPVFRWYTAATGGTAVTGATYTPSPNLTTTTTYYVSVSGSGLSESVRRAVTVNVAAAMNAGAIGSDQSITSGATPATLTSTTAASGGIGTITYNWQRSTNGTTWTNATGTRTNATYIPPALTTTTYFRRQATNTCGTVETSSVTITVGGSADLITVTSNNTDMCSGDAVTLTATASSVTSPVFRWYAAATGGTELHTGANFTPSPNLTTTTTFHVSVSGSGLTEGARKAVTVTVRPTTSPDMIKISQ